MIKLEKVLTKDHVNTLTSQTKGYVDKRISDLATSVSDIMEDVSSSIDALETGKSDHTGNKSNPHGVTKSQVGLGNVPNVATNDQTPTYSQASTLANLSSGEKLSASMGKIMKAIADLISHIGNTSNPHSVTKTQVGLGSVENKSSATIRSEITKENVTTALGYTPPTSNTTYTVATQSANGLMGSGDKTKLDGIETGANKTTVDTALSSTSTNPVQNKVINTALAGKANSSHGNHVPTTETANNAKFLRNDNTWATVTPANIGASESGHTHKYAGSSSAGGSATSAVKLDTATAGSATQPVYFSGGKPVATTYTLGKSVPSDAKFTDTTYSVATTSANGLMSSTDKAKLDATNVSYGTCDTVAETATKVVTLSGNANWTLTTGAIIMVKFTNSNSAESVKLNVNSTGAYPIWYNNAEYTSTGTAYTGYAGRVITYAFNGTHWVWVSGSYDANTQSNTNSTNTSSKIFLIGATKQSSSQTTYSHDTAYVGTDGCVYSGSKKTATVDQILSFKNVSVATSAWASDTTYSNYPYRASITCSGVTADYNADVNFALAEATSGNFAPVCETASNAVYIYAMSKPSASITIPTIEARKAVS